MSRLATVGEQKFQKAGRGFLHRVLISSCHAPKINPVIDMSLVVQAPEGGKDFGEVIRQKSVSGGVVFGPNFRYFPTGQIGVDAVQEGRVLQFWGQHREKMAIVFGGRALFDVGVNVPAEHNGTGR